MCTPCVCRRDAIVITACCLVSMAKAAPPHCRGHSPSNLSTNGAPRPPTNPPSFHYALRKLDILGTTRTIHVRMTVAACLWAGLRKVRWRRSRLSDSCRRAHVSSYWQKQRVHTVRSTHVAQELQALSDLIQDSTVNSCSGQVCNDALQDSFRFSARSTKRTGCARRRLCVGGGARYQKQSKTEHTSSQERNCSASDYAAATLP